MKELIRHILKEETARQTRVISMISQLGLTNTAKAVGGYENLVNILKDTGYFNTKIDVTPKQIHYYLEGDRRYSQSKTYYEIIITDPWELYYDDYNYDVELLMDDLNEENVKDIRKILSKVNEEDLSDVSIDELLEYDESDNIKDALSYAANTVDSGAYGDYLQSQIIKAFEEYGGKVIEFDDTNITFSVDISKYLLEVDDDSIDTFVEGCGLDFSCIFDEMLSYGWIDKVKPEFDDYWYNNNFDESYFNEVVSDRLHEYLNN